MMLYEIVRVLDQFVIRNIVGSLSDSDVALLSQMTDELAAFYDSRDRQAYLEQNLRIHEKIWQLYGNRFLSIF